MRSTGSCGSYGGGSFTPGSSPYVSLSRPGEPPLLQHYEAEPTRLKQGPGLFNATAVLGGIDVNTTAGARNRGGKRGGRGSI